MSIETIYYLLPEFILIVAATLIYVAGAFLAPREIWGWVAAGALVLAGAALFLQPSGASAMSGPLLIDTLGNYARWLALGMGLLLLLLSPGAARGLHAPEFVGSLVLVIAGVMLVAESNELVLMFVGLELVSIPTYVLLYLGRRDLGSQEAATKYFFLSILSSALLLYGFSFLYGVAGSTQLAEIRAALTDPAEGALAGPLGCLALVLVFAGLGFRITAVPFHFYAPDVYQGTTHGNAALLSVVPKIVGLAALVRLVATAMPGLEGFAWRLALVLAVLTMTWGNVAALWQDNLRRLLAYSSIAHAGYMLVGLTVGLAMHQSGEAARFDGIGAMLFYLCIYAVATAGAFAALVYLGSETKQVETVDQLAGVGRTHPLAGMTLAVCMFSLAGIPPLAGFWGKLTLFGSALGVDPASELWPWFLALAIIGVLNAAIAAAYYLRIVSAMYFRPALDVPAGQGGRGAWSAMLICVALTIGLGLYPGRLIEISNDASPAANQLRKGREFGQRAPAEAATTRLSQRHGIPAEQN